jgi:hypothetical protein
LAAQLDRVYAPSTLNGGPVDNLPHRAVEVRPREELLAGRNAKGRTATSARLGNTVVDPYRGSLAISGARRFDHYRTFDAREPPDA